MASFPLCCHSTVTGESFCKCSTSKSKTNELLCDCGEDLDVYEWSWDSSLTSSSALLSKDNREIKFHPGYSSGTAAVRGDRCFTSGYHYYWEIKMLTPVYGTDVMVGVGTTQVDLQQNRYRFCSLLGSDGESWGLSYTGTLHHKGETTEYGPRFGQGSIVGVHLDMWEGTLEFYLNRQPLGIAFRGLRDKVLYPMVSSTAAQSGMRVTYSCSCPASLQLLCIRSMCEQYPNGNSVLQKFADMPGLKALVERKFWWLLQTKLPLNKKLQYKEDRSRESALENFVVEGLDNVTLLSLQRSVESAGKNVKKLKRTQLFLRRNLFSGGCVFGSSEKTLRRSSRNSKPDASPLTRRSLRNRKEK